MTALVGQADNLAAPESAIAASADRDEALELAFEMVAARWPVRTARAGRRLVDAAAVGFTVRPASEWPEGLRLSPDGNPPRSTKAVPASFSTTQSALDADLVAEKIVCLVRQDGHVAELSYVSLRDRGPWLVDGHHGFAARQLLGRSSKAWRLVGGVDYIAAPRLGPKPSAPPREIAGRG